MKGTVPKRLDICYYFGTFYTILNFYFLIIDFNAPVNKIPEGTAERHLRHHVNLNNNYDNTYEPKKSSAVTRAHTVSLFSFSLCETTHLVPGPFVLPSSYY